MAASLFSKVDPLCGDEIVCQWLSILASMLDKSRICVHGPPMDVHNGGNMHLAGWSATQIP